MGQLYSYLHLVDFYGFHVGNYTSPMDPKLDGPQSPFFFCQKLKPDLVPCGRCFRRSNVTPGACFPETTGAESTGG